MTDERHLELDDTPAPPPAPVVVAEPEPEWKKVPRSQVKCSNCFWCEGSERRNPYDMSRYMVYHCLLHPPTLMSEGEKGHVKTHHPVVNLEHRCKNFEKKE